MKTTERFALLRMLTAGPLLMIYADIGPVDPARVIVPGLFPWVAAEVDDANRGRWLRLLEDQGLVRGDQWSPFGRYFSITPAGRAALAEMRGRIARMRRRQWLRVARAAARILRALPTQELRWCGVVAIKMARESAHREAVRPARAS